MLKKLWILGLIGSLMLSLVPVSALASDHDDGELELKGRNTNLTDLYVFREDWQDPSAGIDNLILVMNTNPRSLARQQYFFSTTARYEFHLSRVAADKKDLRPTGADDVTLRFEFGAPDASSRQPITLSVLEKGRLIAKQFAGYTTPLADMNAGKLNVGATTIQGSKVTTFAGLREDSFYFDVERYFRIRGLLATGVNTLGNSPIQGGANVFRSNQTAVDFTVGYNVNSLVVRVPMALLQDKGSKVKSQIFDVWETVSMPADAPACTFTPNFLCTPYMLALYQYFGFFQPPVYQQIERLGRPAINEGLVISNAFLNAYNSIPPTADLSKGAAPVVAEAAAVLTAVNAYGKGAGLPAPAVGDVATGFLPDVMRIDASKSLSPSQWAYNSDAVIVKGTQASAMLTGGRKIEDDVIDITLSYLIAGNPACGPGTACVIPDGVSYSGGTSCSNAGEGTNLGNPGHRCLHGQSSRNGAAKYPFLASPH